MAATRARIRIESRLAQDDINAFRKTIRRTDKRKMARRSAKYVAKYMESNETPRAAANHFYKRKGGAKITVKAGNLRKSTKIFTFRKSEMLHVGPRYLVSFKGNMLGGNKGTSSGFYARWIIEGKTKKKTANDYMGRILTSTSDVARALLASDWEISLDQIAARSLRKGITRWQKYAEAKGRSY